MGMRELHNTITAELESGKTRGILYRELTDKNPENSARIAYVIGCVAPADKRKQTLKINAALTLLLILNAVFCVLAELPINLQDPTLFIVLKTVAPLVFCYFVFRFFGPVYRFIGLWSLIDFLETVLTSPATDNTFVAFKMIIVFLVMTISWYIARKVFPNLGFIGPKKDGLGNYILE